VPNHKNIDSRNFYFKEKDDLNVKKTKTDQKKLKPVQLLGKTIAQGFWGLNWVNHIENLYGQNEPIKRAIAFARNDQIFHLDIGAGLAEAAIFGQVQLKKCPFPSIFHVTIKIKPLSKERLQKIIGRIGGYLPSLKDLLSGDLPYKMVEAFLDPQEGLLPSLGEIESHCTCGKAYKPCVHLAGALYGMANRLDKAPELFFLLRKIDPLSFLASLAQFQDELKPAPPEDILRGDLSAIFGIDLPPPEPEASPSQSLSEKALSANGPAPELTPIAKPAQEARPDPQTEPSQGFLRGFEADPADKNKLDQGQARKKPREERPNHSKPTCSLYEMDRLLESLVEKRLSNQRPNDSKAAEELSPLDRALAALAKKRPSH
jgi:uncharacterized Zn finger protein